MPRQPSDGSIALDMKNRIATSVAAVSVAALVAWLAHGSPETRGAGAQHPASSPTQQRAGGDPAARGSALPCAVPLSWRIAWVDLAFGLADVAARAAVQSAADVWENAVGTRLFVHDPEHGFPIRFVHDHRQAHADARQRAEADLRSADRTLDMRRDTVERRARDHQRELALFQERARGLEVRVAHHNRAVSDWNDRGGAPPDTVRVLSALGAALDAEAAELGRLRHDLEASAREIQRNQRLLNDAIAAHNRRVEGLRSAFPAESVQSALYREEARVEGGRVLSVTRGVTVFRFDDVNDLVRILAHELGHALGLGHVNEPGALMHEEYGRRPGVTEGLIHARDMELFRDRCPHLMGG